MATQQLFSETGTVSEAAEAFEAVLTGQPVDQEENDEAADVVVEDSADAEVESESEEEVEEEVEETDDDATDDEEDDDDESAEQEQEAEILTQTVMVNGEEIEVTLEELKSGYSRTADYTKKTQALAEQRKQLDGELDAVRQERAAYSQLLNQLQQQVEQGSSEPEPDWGKLLDEDPVEYVRQKEYWKAKIDRAAAIRSEQARLQGLQQQESEQTLRAHLTSEAAKLTQALPEWSDPKVAESEKVRLREFGKKVGFTDQEMSQIYDHRAVLALRKAMLYDELTSKQPKTQAKVQKAKTLRAGSAASVPKAKDQLTKAKQRLSKSGSTRDAAAAFEFILSNS